jgi:hypothetical protein
MRKLKIKPAGIAQLVEQRTENPRVRSSNLRPGIHPQSTYNIFERLGKLKGFFLTLFFGLEPMNQSAIIWLGRSWSYLAKNSIFFPLCLSLLFSSVVNFTRW